MNDRIKILHIITNLPIGGAQDNTLYTLELLDKGKYDVSLACNLCGEFVERANSIVQCKIYNIKYLAREINLFKDLRATLELVKLMRKEKFQIVHTHSSKPGVIGRIAAFISCVPVLIHTVHGFPFHDFMNIFKRKYLLLVERAMNSITTHLITVSKLNLKKIIDLGLATENKITNIYSGIDFKKFQVLSKSSIRNELGINPKIRLVGFVGRLSEQKAPLTYSKAIAKVVKLYPDCHFIFVGDGPKRTEIEKFINKKQLDSRVSLLGTRKDIPEIINSLDLFVLSSIYEGLGRSLTEALYCKVPVVATKVDGVPELIQDNKTGLLVPPEDCERLAEAIVYALNNPGKMKRLAKEGHKFVKLHFDVKQMVKKIEIIYEELLTNL